MKTLAVLVVLLAGCDLYWNTNNGDDVCANGGYSPPAQIDEQLRDPQNGQCEDVSVGGGGGCYPCGPCDKEPAQMVPDWPTCSGSCEALGETACLATAGCHAAYLDDTVGSGATDLEFWSCWEVAPSGPVEGGGCAALDAQDCSRHDDCEEIYNSASDQFESCAAEPGTDACSGVDITCPSNSHCEEQCNICDGANAGPCMGGCTPTCVPDQACDSQSCPANYQCEETCSADNTVCTNECVPVGNDAGSCTGAVTCTIAIPACPSGTTAGIANGCYTGYCIPNADCGPGNPGDCTTTGAMCALAPPACPSGTVPGITNGCWSGYCIPDAACPVPACEMLTSESACTARPDCLAIYNGMNCTCDGSTDTCTCETETYARCETLMGL